MFLSALQKSQTLYLLGYRMWRTCPRPVFAAWRLALGSSFSPLSNVVNAINTIAIPFSHKFVLARSPTGSERETSLCPAAAAWQLT